MTKTRLARRAAAVGVFLGLTSLLWIAVLQPMSEILFGSKDGLEKDKEHLAIARLDAQAAPLLQVRLQSALRDLQTSKLFWHNAASTDVSAAVQTRIRQVVTEAGGSVVSTADLATHTEHGFLRIQVRADISESTAALYRTLHNLESSTPALLVDSLELRALPASGPREEPRLSAAITLSTYQMDGS